MILQELITKIANGDIRKAKKKILQWLTIFSPLKFLHTTGKLIKNYFLKQLYLFKPVKANCQESIGSGQKIHVRIITEIFRALIRMNLMHRIRRLLTTTLLHLLIILFQIQMHYKWTGIKSMKQIKYRIMHCMFYR